MGSCQYDTLTLTLTPLSLFLPANFASEPACQAPAHHEKPPAPTMAGVTSGHTVNSAHAVAEIIECGYLTLRHVPSAMLASDTGSSLLPHGVRVPASKPH